MTVGRYPPNKLQELIKIYGSPGKPTYPDFLKKLEHWSAQITSKKFKTYAVYECPDDKIQEAMMALAKRYSFYAGVEGYTFKIELILDADEAIKYML